MSEVETGSGRSRRDAAPDETTHMPAEPAESIIMPIISWMRRFFWRRRVRRVIANHVSARRAGWMRRREEAALNVWADRQRAAEAEYRRASAGWGPGYPVGVEHFGAEAGRLSKRHYHAEVWARAGLRHAAGWRDAGIA